MYMAVIIIGIVVFLILAIGMAIAISQEGKEDKGEQGDKKE
jgi:hypothetical protein